MDQSRELLAQISREGIVPLLKLHGIMIHTHPDDVISAEERALRDSEGKPMHEEILVSIVHEELYKKGLSMRLEAYDSRFRDEFRKRQWALLQGEAQSTHNGETYTTVGFVDEAGDISDHVRCILVRNEEEMARLKLGPRITIKRSRPSNTILPPPIKPQGLPLNANAPRLTTSLSPSQPRWPATQHNPATFPPPANRSSIRNDGQIGVHVQSNGVGDEMTRVEPVLQKRPIRDSNSESDNDMPLKRKCSGASRNEGLVSEHDGDVPPNSLLARATASKSLGLTQPAQGLEVFQHARRTPSLEPSGGIRETVTSNKQDRLQYPGLVQRAPVANAMSQGPLISFTPQTGQRTNEEDEDDELIAVAKIVDEIDSIKEDVAAKDIAHGAADKEIEALEEKIKKAREEMGKFLEEKSREKEQWAQRQKEKDQQLKEKEQKKASLQRTLHELESRLRRT